MVAKFTLDSFFPQRATLERRIYPHFQLPVVPRPNILTVNLKRLAFALKGDDAFWASNIVDRREGANFILGKYDYAVGEIRAGRPLDMPWLMFEYGRTTITDGRHRLYALIDEGFSHCPVVVDDAFLPMISTLVDDVDQPTRIP